MNLLELQKAYLQALQAEASSRDGSGDNSALFAAIALTKPDHVLHIYPPDADGFVNVYVSSPSVSPGEILVGIARQRIGP